MANFKQFLLEKYPNLDKSPFKIKADAEDKTPFDAKLFRCQRLCVAFGMVFDETVKKVKSDSRIKELVAQINKIYYKTTKKYGRNPYSFKVTNDVKFNIRNDPLDMRYLESKELELYIKNHPNKYNSILSLGYNWRFSSCEGWFWCDIPQNHDEDEYYLTKYAGNEERLKHFLPSTYGEGRLNNNEILSLVSKIYAIINKIFSTELKRRNFIIEREALGGKYIGKGSEGYTFRYRDYIDRKNFDEIGKLNA
jgi:hypothetical protein